MAACFDNWDLRTIIFPLQSFTRKYVTCRYPKKIISERRHVLYKKLTLFFFCNVACPADAALASTLYADFTKGAASRFLASGTTANVAYTQQNGAGLTVARQGDSPILASDFYFMFGRVDVVMQAAPGTGIVSSIVLQSDDLDEVDWEFLGGDSGQVQTNYFGKGYDATYNRAAFLATPQPVDTTFNTYSLVWTASSITWLINGVASRTLNYAESEDAGAHFPQTPMQVKVGVWAGGDPSNSPGTIGMFSYNTKTLPNFS